MARPIGDLVDIRATAALPWLPGTVRAVTADCYGVELDVPVTSDTWSGVTRKYGGADLVGTADRYVFIYQQVEKITPDELIRNQGG